jgi:hypothetical protein
MAYGLLDRNHYVRASGLVLLTLGLIVLVFVAAQRVFGADTAPRPLNIRDYRLTFNEDFDRLDVSARGPGTRWIAHTPWNRDFGDARFLDPGPGGPFRVAGGILSIDMRRGPDGKWGGGLLASVDPKGKGFTQSGGYFEMRARFPDGTGVWPAFWLATLGAESDIKPEVDAVEYYGRDNKGYYVNLHLWQNGKDIYNRNAHVVIPAGAATSGFHLYGVSVAPDFVTFYFDRQQVARLASRPEFMHPMMLLTNLAAGGGWPITGMPDPSTMEIDYIRAYAPKGG